MLIPKSSFIYILIFLISGARYWQKWQRFAVLALWKIPRKCLHILHHLHPSTNSAFPAFLLARCHDMETISVLMVMYEGNPYRSFAWWRHQMETFSALLAFVRWIHRSPVNSPHKGQWRGALIFSLTCARINDWVNNREAGDLRRHRDHYDVLVMVRTVGFFSWRPVPLCEDRWILGQHGFR